MRDCGLRKAYQRGCRCQPCIRANAAYMSCYRSKTREGTPLEWAVVNGYRTSKLVQRLHSEGYQPRMLARIIGVSRRTTMRHRHSCPVAYAVMTRIQGLCERLEEGSDTVLEDCREKAADAMLHTLGRELLTNAKAWQNLTEREGPE